MTTHWINSLSWFHYLNFKQKEQYHVARFEKRSCYSVIRLEHDLLGDWVITATNGRTKSKLGQTRTRPFLNFSEAFEHFFSLTIERYQRGYHLINYQTDDILYKLILCSINPSVSLSTQKHTVITKIKKTSTVKTIKVNEVPYQPAQQIAFLF